MRFRSWRPCGWMILMVAVFTVPDRRAVAEETPSWARDSAPRLLARDEAGGPGSSFAVPIAATEEQHEPPSALRVAAPAGPERPDDSPAPGGAPAADGGGRQPTPAPTGPGTATAASEGAFGVRLHSSAEVPQAAEEEPPLEPIPEGEPAGPVEVQAASFKGATPGATTAAELAESWGRPAGSHEEGGLHTKVFAIEPFEQVEATFYEETLVSIVIRLQKAFPAQTVAQQLDLATIRPVFVSNELGEVLGQAFPERGVLFAFEPAPEGEGPTMLVAQIILESITPEPFLLRAETHLESLPHESLGDLDEVVKLQPELARAHWLRARALAAVGDVEEATAAVGRAIELDEANPRFRVTHAQLLIRSGRHEKAAAVVQQALARSDSLPHVKARAVCLAGELAATASPRDYRRALERFTEAIQLADPLVADPHPAIATAAKEALLDAHLGAAAAIAWGAWQRKEEAVPHWLDRADVIAQNLAKNTPGGEAYRFRFAVRSLGACVGLEGRLDPSPWIDEVQRSGEALLEQALDAERTQQIDWELGMAFYDAVQIQQMRGEHDAALGYGEKAIEHFEASGVAERGVANHRYLLGRLHFRLGAIHALAQENHQAAITWFDKAVPLLEEPLPGQAAGDLGRHGETFVSMAVSYWETGQQQKAVELTERGLSFMEEAVRAGKLDEDALAVPYGNLATMHEHLGQDASAKEFAEMAGRLRENLH